MFAGEVVAIHERGPDAPDQRIDVEFAVDEVWKGEPTANAEIRTHADEATCGYPFEEGVAYLVYAGRSEDALTTGLCSRTSPVEAADEDLEGLGAGTAPAASEDDATAGDDDPGRQTMPGLTVAAALALVVLLAGGWWRGRRRPTPGQR